MANSTDEEPLPDAGSKPAAKVLGREAKQPLPKRFYAIARHRAADDGFRILLDERPVKTPRKSILALPTAPLAEAIAAEWSAQTVHIDPETMPLTRLANTAIDGVASRIDDVRTDIVKYAGSDLVCYRSDGTRGLIERQTMAWDPVLSWARETLGARFILTEGIIHVSQPEPALAKIADAVTPLDAFQLTAVHVMTTLTGSALLALAIERGRLTLDQAWHAAHVDEDWQIGQWGEDAEASARRERRRAEFDAAARFLALLV